MLPQRTPHRRQLALLAFCLCAAAACSQSEPAPLRQPAPAATEAGSSGGAPAAGAPGGTAVAGGTGAAAPAGWTLGGDVARGRQVYAANCAGCHGDGGDGRGEAAGALEPKPTNFTDAALLRRRSDWDLYRVVRDGGTAAGLSPSMVGFAPMLPDSDLRSVAAFVRTFAHPGGAAGVPVQSGH